MKILKYLNEKNGVLSPIAVASEDFFSKRVALPYKLSQGYKGDEGGIIGKSAKTGQDRPDAQKTTRFAVPMLSPDGDYTYWPSPDNRPEYVDWRDYIPNELPDSVEFPQGEEFPEEWNIEREL